MIYVGTRVLDHVYGVQGEVVVSASHTADVHWDGNPEGSYSTHVLADFGANSESRLIILSGPVHTVPEPPTSPYATRLIEHLAYNNGLMESRLELMWWKASRLADSSRRVNPHDTHASWARLAESIARTADLMRPRPNSDGTEETTSLFNLIYSDRK